MGAWDMLELDMSAEIERKVLTDSFPVPATIDLLSAALQIEPTLLP